MYGVNVRTQAPFADDSVRVPARTPLPAVAMAAGIPTADVGELNPHLLRGMTPPYDSYLVRIPVGRAAGFDSAFAALPSRVLIATHVLESKKGNTVQRLALAHGISESTLRSFNPGLRTLKSGRLAPGQAVLLPTAAVAAAALNVPDPSIERYTGSTPRLKTHTVTKGETVRTIARKYATTPERIMRLNGLNRPMIFPGQSLVVSGRVKRKSGASSTAGARSKNKARKS